MRTRVNGVAEVTEREAPGDGVTLGFLRDKGALVAEGAGGMEWHQDPQHPQSTEVSRVSVTAAMLEVKGTCWKSH